MIKHVDRKNNQYNYDETTTQNCNDYPIMGTALNHENFPSFDIKDSDILYKTPSAEPRIVHLVSKDTIQKTKSK